MIIYRLLSDLTDDDMSVSQVFDEYADDYKYVEATGEIVKSPERVNIQAKIDSYRSTALDVLLNKYLGNDDSVSGDPGYVDHDYGRLYNDLADLGQCIEIANDYRDRYGLDDGMSVVDVYKFVQGKLDTLNSEIAAKQSGNVVKGGVDHDETQKTAETV